MATHSSDAGRAGRLAGMVTGPVFLPGDAGYAQEVSAHPRLRLDLNTGAFQGVPLSMAPDHATLLITPLLTANRDRPHQAS